MDKLKRIQTRARELAQSGKFHGWSPIAFELRFEDGFDEAREWLYTTTTRDELDRLCQLARASKNAAAQATASNGLIGTKPPNEMHHDDRTPTNYIQPASNRSWREYWPR